VAGGSSLANVSSSANITATQFQGNVSSTNISGSGFLTIGNISSTANLTVSQGQFTNVSGTSLFGGALQVTGASNSQRLKLGQHHGVARTIYERVFDKLFRLRLRLFPSLFYTNASGTNETLSGYLRYGNASARVKVSRDHSKLRPRAPWRCDLDLKRQFVNGCPHA